MTKKHKDEVLEKKLLEFKKREMDLFHQFHKSPWKVFLFNFLAGTAKGLGFFLGAAVVIAVLGYFLGQFLSEVPYLGDFFKNASEWLKANQPGGSITP